VAGLSSSFASSLSSSDQALSVVASPVTYGLSPSTASVSVAADGRAVALAEQAQGTQACWYQIDNSMTESTTGNGAWSVAGFPVAAGTYYGEAAYLGTGVVPIWSAAARMAAAANSVVYQVGGFPQL
jgi:hypothetical protein